LIQANALIGRWGSPIFYLDFGEGFNLSNQLLLIFIGITVRTYMMSSDCSPVVESLKRENGALNSFAERTVWGANTKRVCSTLDALFFFSALFIYPTIKINRAILFRPNKQHRAPFVRA
jgi:hypothetical protein